MHYRGITHRTAYVSMPIHITQLMLEYRFTIATYFAIYRFVIVLNDLNSQLRSAFHVSLLPYTMDTRCDHHYYPIHSLIDHRYDIRVWTDSASILFCVVNHNCLQ